MRRLRTGLIVFLRPYHTLHSILEAQIRDLVARYERTCKCSAVDCDDEDLFYTSTGPSASCYTAL